MANKRGTVSSYEWPSDWGQVNRPPLYSEMVKNHEARIRAENEENDTCPREPMLHLPCANYCISLY